MCGSPDYPDRIGMKIEGEINDAARTIEIEISASFGSDCEEATWALESIEIELK